MQARRALAGVAAVGLVAGLGIAGAGSASAVPESLSEECALMASGAYDGNYIGRACQVFCVRGGGVI